MRLQALSGGSVARVSERRPTSVWSITRFVLDRYLLLPIGIGLGLVWANTAGESYFRFAQAVAFPVNEIGMALFLALVAQELLEAVMPGGALHSWRQWGTPLAGAAGGVAGAALVFLAWVYGMHEDVLAQAWPVALCIDIAAAYYLLRSISRRPQPLAFLLVMAAATDAVALLLLGGWTPVGPRHVIGAALIIAAGGSAAVMRRVGLRSFWPYLGISGLASWAGLYMAGVHPALALIPIVPFLPREPRRVDVLADAPHDDAVHRAEHRWHEAVQVVLFFFGFVNGGVLLRGYDTGTWAILAAALIGRPLGMLAGVGLARAAGLRVPGGVDWRMLTVIAFAASSGPTLALFLAPAILPPGGVLQQIKMGTLVTMSGAVLAVACAALLRVGRNNTRSA